MSSHPSSWLSTIAQWFLWASLFLIVLGVAPVLINFMVATKVLFVLILALGLVALFIYQSSFQKSITFVNHPLLIPLVTFGIAVGLSTFLSSNYPVENVVGWGGVYLSFVMIAVLGGSVLPKEAALRFNTILTTLATVLALSTILQAIGLGPSRFLNMLFEVQLPNTGFFSVTGAPFNAAQVFLVIGLALGVSGFYRKQFTSVDLVGLAMSIIGLGASAYFALPGKEGYPVILPLSASWSIALDTLHNFRAALVGLGPENYVAAYTQFRPAWTNGQSWWNLFFIQATNVPLTLIVTTGFIGLFSWCYLAVKLVLEGIKQHNLTNPAAVMAVSILVLNLFVPANVVLISLQAVAVAVWIASQKSSTNVVTIHFLQVYASGGTTKSLALNKIIGGILALIILAGGVYGLGRVYAASYAFYQGSMALAQNDAVTGYTRQQLAVSLNPYFSSYRSSYALTNMGIALALSSKTDLNEEEQGQVTQLVQQSIREARAATVLRPDLASNWQILAQVYRNLIGTAEGADQWTVTSYVSAIERAPRDPQLRVELGQIFYQLKQYDQAVALFSQAAELKPDLVNAYYNGANALKAWGKLEDAEKAYQKTLTLLEPDSEDYVAASKELEALQAEIAKLPKKPVEGEEGQETTQQRAVPSITEQNLLEPANETVADPGTQDLNVSEPVPTPVASPSTSPVPSASPTL